MCTSKAGASGSRDSVGVKRQTVPVQPIESEALGTMLVLYLEAIAIYLDVDLTRDIKCVKARVANEGFGFLAKTLPRYLSWLRMCQEKEKVVPCPGFKTIRRRDWKLKTPSFLRGLSRLLIDDSDQLIFLADPGERERQQFAYRAISVICQTFGKKYEVPLSDFRMDLQKVETLRADHDDRFQIDDLIDFLDGPDAAILDYVKEDLSAVFEPYEHVGLFEEDGEVLWGKHTHEFDAFEAVPAHGAGAVSYPCKQHEKFTDFMGFPPHFKNLGEYEDCLYLPGEATAFGPPFNPDRKERYDLAIGGVGRLELVPKDAEKGRGVNLEMKEFMFPQQSARKSLYAWLESSPMTRDRVNFTNQTINQKLALQASRDGKLVTADFSEASESVTRVLINNTFDPRELEWLNPLRSRFTRTTISSSPTDVNVEENIGTNSRCKLDRMIRKAGLSWPDSHFMLKDCISDTRPRSVVNGEQTVLFAENEKYAPMGSALCFPVEALIFWAVTRAVIKHELILQSEEDAIAEEISKVWIYGDDLIFPVRYFERVVEVFSQLRIRLNEKKSFHYGPFRESCGVDAYDGLDVSPTCRITTRLPIRSLHTTDSNHARSLVAWIEYANMFEADGFPTVAKYIRRTVTTQYPSAKSIPRLAEEYLAGGLFWLDYDGWTIEEFLSSPGMRDEQDRRGYFSCGRSVLDPSFDPKKDGVKPSYSRKEYKIGPVPPYFQGKIRRNWTQSITQYRADISENERRLRYYSEGSESPGATNWFADKNSFGLKRPTIFFS